MGTERAARRTELTNRAAGGGNVDDYAGRVLADRYRLPLPPSDEYELTDTRAFDTYSGQEVLVRQVPLPEVVEAEVLDAEGLPDGFTARDGRARRAGGGRGGRGGPAGGRPTVRARGGPPTPWCGERSRPRRPRRPFPTIHGWTRSSTCSRRA